eukprot:TRINITY_DN30796_c1_g1_i1.p1 TRINITY_DN30796_c1_g1~~TRINITY_DN30796_c1_g1_i1.p1  ORF type:complete len:392 (+),score=110.43 TRINITY_DN30796_c1_g1_i1:61-1176(+)
MKRTLCLLALAAVAAALPNCTSPTYSKKNVRLTALDAASNSLAVCLVEPPSQVGHISILNAHDGSLHQQLGLECMYLDDKTIVQDAGTMSFAGSRLVWFGQKGTPLHIYDVSSGDHQTLTSLSDKPDITATSPDGSVLVSNADGGLYAWVRPGLETKSVTVLGGSSSGTGAVSAQRFAVSNASHIMMYDSSGARLVIQEADVSSMQFEGDDLMVVLQGSAALLLKKYTATGGVISQQNLSGFGTVSQDARLLLAFEGSGTTGGDFRVEDLNTKAKVGVCTASPLSFPDDLLFSTYNSTFEVILLTTTANETAFTFVSHDMASGSSSTSTSVIVGVAVGGVVFVLLASALVYYCMRKKTLSRDAEKLINSHQ